jgi:hypothetical protein
LQHAGPDQAHRLHRNQHEECRRYKIQHRQRNLPPALRQPHDQDVHPDKAVIPHRQRRGKGYVQHQQHPRKLLRPRKRLTEKIPPDNLQQHVRSQTDGQRNHNNPQKPDKLIE